MPFLDVGYSRPLQKDGACVRCQQIDFLIVKVDLWDFPKNLQTSSIVNEVEATFFRRCPPEQRPSFLRSGNSHSSSPPISDSEDATKDADLESNSEDVILGQRTKKKPLYDSSLIKALNQTFFYRWWFAGVLKLFAGATFYASINR